MLSRTTYGFKDLTLDVRKMSSPATGASLTAVTLRLMVPVALYHLAIVTMAVAAVVADLDHSWVVAGALFFMLSDALIAIEKFKKPFAGVGHAIWSTYYFAQYLICFGMLVQLAS